MPKPVGDIDKEKDSNGGRKSVQFLSVKEKQMNKLNLRGQAGLSE